MIDLEILRDYLLEGLAIDFHIWDRYTGNVFHLQVCMVAHVLPGFGRVFLKLLLIYRFMVLPVILVILVLPVLPVILVILVLPVILLLPAILYSDTSDTSAPSDISATSATSEIILTYLAFHMNYKFKQGF